MSPKPKQVNTVSSATQPARWECSPQGDPLERGKKLKTRRKIRNRTDVRKGNDGGRETKTNENKSLSLNFSQEKDLGKTSTILYANPLFCHRARINHKKAYCRAAFSTSSNTFWESVLHNKNTKVSS